MRYGARKPPARSDDIQTRRFRVPTAQVPLIDGTQGVVDKITELEAAGAFNISVSAVGDHHLIAYDTKPRVGRPPKLETRSR